jgi:hypothetical protein
MSRHPTCPERPSRAWINFSYISSGASILMVGGGILALSLGWWIRACFAIVMAMAVQSGFKFAKTVRDIDETKWMMNRLEEARAGKLLSVAATHEDAALMPHSASRPLFLATHLT